MSTIHYVATDKLAAVRERAALNKSNLTPPPHHPSLLRSFFFFFSLLFFMSVIHPSKKLQDAFTHQPSALLTRNILTSPLWQTPPCDCVVVHGFCCSEIALMPLFRMSQSMGQLLEFCSFLGKDFLVTSIVIKRWFAHLTTKRFLLSTRIIYFFNISTICTY